MTGPLVSIIITSYNRADFIEAALKSALEQDYDHLEIIISDNKSTDDTDAVIRKYTGDQRIKYFVNNENIGMIPNFRIATEERATGDYITYLSSDDYLNNSSFISGAVKLIEKYPDVVLAAAKNSTLDNSTSVLTEDANDYVYAEEFMEGTKLFHLFPEWFAPGWGGVIMKRQELLETKIFESRAQSLDYEANLKLMLTGNVVFMKTPSYVFRRHPSQASLSADAAAQIRNFDFIENAATAAQKTRRIKNLSQWKADVYVSYLEGLMGQFAKKPAEFNLLLSHVKKEKNISISFFSQPKFMMLLFLYRNFHLVKYPMKALRPGLYHSIKKNFE